MRGDTFMRENTRISDLSLIGLLNDKNITIPSYQRKFKWNAIKQRELIDSIKNKYPIGVITTYIKDGKTYILDGLQRLSTVSRFIDNPASVFTWAALNDYGYLDSFDLQIEEQNLTKAKKKILTSTFKSIYEQNQLNDYKRISAFLKFINDNPNNVNNVFILDEIEDVFHEFHKIFDIGDYRVAVIMYEGNTDHVADIFEKMNTGSILLSKYEVYAATWVDYVFNDELISDEIMKYSRIHYKYISENLGNIEDDLKYNHKNIAELFIGFSYKYLNSISEKTIKNVIPKVKEEVVEGRRYFSRNEVFHQIVASICELKPNNINDFVEKHSSILKSGNSMKIKLLDFICDICNKSIQLYDEVSTKILDISQGENTLDYLYFYINTVFFFIYYQIRDDFLIIDRKLSPDQRATLIDELINKQTIIKEEWFKNKNRQVSFVNEKIKDAKFAIETLDSISKLII
jgi:hypothetical protein